MHLSSLAKTPTGTAPQYLSSQFSGSLSLNNTVGRQLPPIVRFSPPKGPRGRRLRPELLQYYCIPHLSCANTFPRLLLEIPEADGEYTYGSCGPPKTSRFGTLNQRLENSPNKPRELYKCIRDYLVKLPLISSESNAVTEGSQNGRALLETVLLQRLLDTAEFYGEP